MSEAVFKLEKHNQQETILHYQEMLRYAPINVMYCDRDLIIRFVNEQSKTTLKKIEHLLPVKVDQVVGTCIDAFHKNPSHQRRMLADDKNLPHRAIIELQDEKLDLYATPIYNEKNEFVGTMVTWDLVTEKLKNETDLARIKCMLDNAPVNVMTTDMDFRLIYLNKKSVETLKRLEKYLPVPPDKVIGQKIDIFHKNPEHQKRMLLNDKNLPHTAKIKLGPEMLDLMITAIYDQEGKYIGPMVTWDIITQKVALVRDITEASQHLAASAAELSATASHMEGNAQRTNNESNSVATASEEVARGVQAVATNTEEMVASIKEITRNASDASHATNATVTEADTTNTMIQKLGDSSQEIGNVIKVISSIAQQTNLLALNATIEAARAGEAGKGFAVVANEVKELAKQTAKATEEITQKIGGIQKDTTSAVGAIGTITKSIQKINGIATAIAAAVEEQQATTTEVSRVVQESARGVQSITDSIKNVSSASSETQFGASQVLDAAKSLSELAEKLQVLVKNIEV